MAVIGVAGAHHSGKTTLISKVSSVNVVPIVTNFMPIYASDKSPFEKQMAMIERLKTLVDVSHDQSSSSIFDRTFLDIASFSWFLKESGKISADEYDSIVRACFNFQQGFDFVIILPPIRIPNSASDDRVAAGKRGGIYSDSSFQKQWYGKILEMANDETTYYKFSPDVRDSITSDMFMGFMSNK